MTAEEVLKNEKPRLSDYLYSNPVKYALVGAMGVMALWTGAVLTQRFLDDYLPNRLIQKNVIGGPQPDLCIQRDNVWYCSTVDGKSLDQLIQGSKQR